MRNARHCYVHSFGDWDLPLWKNPTIQCILSIAGLAFAVYACSTGATKQKQEESLALQQQLMAEMLVIRSRIEEQSLIELPGQTFTMMARFFPNSTGTREYIFDFGDEAQLLRSRISAYLTPDNKVGMEVVDDSQKTFTLYVAPSEAAFSFGKRSLWYFEYGGAGNEFYLRVWCDGRVIAERQFSEAVSLRKSNPQCHFSLGADLRGKHLGRWDMWSSSVSTEGACLTKAQKIEMMEALYAFEHAVQRDELPEWHPGRFRGDHYVRSDLSGERARFIKIDGSELK